MRRISCLAALSLCAAIAGCGQSNYDTVDNAPAKKTPEYKQPIIGGGRPNPDPVKPAAPTGPSEVVKAEPGVAAQGRSLDQYQQGVEAVISQPAKTLFTVREKAVFEIAIPQAMQLYKATHGHFPKTHEDFMKDVIDANRINLPRLIAGQHYLYDPEKAELMVQRPKR